MLGTVGTSALFAALGASALNTMCGTHTSVTTSRLFIALYALVLGTAGPQIIPMTLISIIIIIVVVMLIVSTMIIIILAAILIIIIIIGWTVGVLTIVFVVVLISIDIILSVVSPFGIIVFPSILISSSIASSSVSIMVSLLVFSSPIVSVPLGDLEFFEVLIMVVNACNVAGVCALRVRDSLQDGTDRRMTAKISSSPSRRFKGGGRYSMYRFNCLIRATKSRMVMSLGFLALNNNSRTFSVSLPAQNSLMKAFMVV
jgi:hypothetical protein